MPKKLPISKPSQLFYGILLCCSLILPQSCRKESGFPHEDKTASGDNLKEQLIKAGYKEDQIKDFGTYYLVEGDILFRKESEYPVLKAMAEEAKEGVKTEQARADYLISDDIVESITIYIHPSVMVGGATSTNPDNWYYGIIRSMAEWAKIDAKVNFFLANEPSIADITVQDDGGVLPNNVIAAAEYPTSGGSAGYRIMINLDFLSNTTVSDGTKKYNMAHEIGHCLGLRHTNWRTNDIDPAQDIPGTPGSDPNSVMNGGTALNSWVGFSQYDTIAIKTLYPHTAQSKIITYPNLKYSVYQDITSENAYVLLTDDGVMTMTWNAAALNSSTVTIDVLLNKQYLKTMAHNVPNTGSYNLNFSNLFGGLPSPGPAANGSRQLRITSDAQPAIFDITPGFRTVFP